MKPKRELIRIVRPPASEDGASGAVMLDMNGKANGRGAYVCPNRECLNRIRKSGAAGRQLKVAIPDDVWERLESQVSENEQ
jgi:predicted RNA-binding protein YlxR (DUF448 family)